MQYNLRATCICGHSEVIDGISLWWLFERKGRNQSLRAIGKYLICARCLKDGQKVNWPAIQTPRDMRKAGELVGSNVATLMRGLRDHYDQTGKRMADSFFVPHQAH